MVKYRLRNLGELERDMRMGPSNPGNVSDVTPKIYICFHPNSTKT